MVSSRLDAERTHVENANGQWSYVEAYGATLQRPEHDLFSDHHALTDDVEDDDGHSRRLCRVNRELYRGRHTDRGTAANIMFCPGTFQRPILIFKAKVQ